MSSSLYESAGHMLTFLLLVTLNSPYSAMCPHGPSGVVMGGRHAVTFSVDGEQYAPVLGGENHWVQIGTMGDGTNVCKTHRQLNGHGPEWGVNKDNEELKRHVMCCTV